MQLFPQASRDYFDSKWCTSTPRPPQNDVSELTNARIRFVNERDVGAAETCKRIQFRILQVNVNVCNVPELPIWQRAVGPRVCVWPYRATYNPTVEKKNATTRDLFQFVLIRSFALLAATIMFRLRSLSTEMPPIEKRLIRLRNSVVIRRTLSIITTDANRLSNVSNRLSISINDWPLRR